MTTLTGEELRNITAQVQEAGGEYYSEDEVREIADGFLKHGAWGGGNKWGIVGTFVARLCEKTLEARRK